MGKEVSKWMRNRGIPYIPEITAGWGDEKMAVAMKNLLKTVVTNIDKPVFVFQSGVPAEMVAASMARYSRNSKTLRWILGKEFLAGQEKSKLKSLDTSGAKAFFKRVLVEYGDDSVAQLGSIAVGAEYVSQVAVKAIEDGRLGAYLEKSTRYLDFSRKVDDKYLYIRPREISKSGLMGEYERVMNQGFDLYVEALIAMRVYLEKCFPKNDDEDEKVWKSAIRSKAFDVVRVFLPMANLTNVGMVMSAQALEMMLTKMMAANLSEVVNIAGDIKTEVEKVAPTLVERLSVDMFGGVAIRRFRDVNKQTKQMVGELTKQKKSGRHKNKVKLVWSSKENLNRILVWMVQENSDLNFSDSAKIVAGLNKKNKQNLIGAYLGERKDRRHKPGRAFELAKYTFELETTVGEWRDLQRHRMLTPSRQLLNTKLGWTVPAEFEKVEINGNKLTAVYEEYMKQNDKLYDRIKQKCGAEVAQYAVRFGNIMRWSIDVNLRELYHMIPLRAGKAGHPNYRAIAREMFYLLMEKDPELVGPMAKFVDFSDEPSLERRNQLKRVASELKKLGWTDLNTDTFNQK